jgi:hypothetical protein
MRQEKGQYFAHGSTSYHVRMYSKKGHHKDGMLKCPYFWLCSNKGEYIYIVMINHDQT